jgi:hypothetical protein
MPDTPYHLIVADLLTGLDESQHEHFEERAGILEFDAGLDRQLAETLALLEIVRLHGWPPTQHK